MEGGSPAAIWQRWNLPMYAAQLRYWADHPRLETLAAAYLGLKPRKTPPPGAAAAKKLDWSLLD